MTLAYEAYYGENLFRLRYMEQILSAIIWDDPNDVALIRSSTASSPKKLQLSLWFCLFPVFRHDTLLHNSTYMADRVCTIVFQPFRNNCHKTMNIKRHYITLV